MSTRLWGAVTAVCGFTIRRLTGIADLADDAATAIETWHNRHTPVPRWTAFECDFVPCPPTETLRIDYLEGTRI